MPHHQHVQAQARHPAAAAAARRARREPASVVVARRSGSRLGGGEGRKGIGQENK